MKFPRFSSYRKDRDKDSHFILTPLGHNNKNLLPHYTGTMETSVVQDHYNVIPCIISLLCRILNSFHNKGVSGGWKTAVAVSLPCASSIVCG